MSVTAGIIIVTSVVVLQLGWLGRERIVDFAGGMLRSTDEERKPLLNDDTPLIKQLDPRLLPAPASAGREARRLVIVGDVHGCISELQALLDKVHFNRSNDHLILVGDIVAKGPDTPGVINLARSLNASCVRGNHEEKLLEEFTKMQRNGKTKNHEPTHAKALAHTLPTDMIEWIASLPIALQLGKIPALKTDNAVVVHAGLQPDRPLHAQNTNDVMNMRAIHKGKKTASANRMDGEPWYEVWNEAQQLLPESKRTFVIYGHDAGTGLMSRPYSLGLDSACVKGQKLSAAVITGGPDGKFEISAVKCLRKHGYAE